MPAETAAAYAACERLARDHYENFPVASRLLPRAMRPHVAAVYAFARVADDYADEGALPADERHRRLDEWLIRLRRCAGDTARNGGLRAAGASASHAGQPPPGLRRPAGASAKAGALAKAGAASAGDALHDQIFLALGETIRRCRLPVGLFEDLLSAFRQDVTVRRYATWDAVLDYCRRSANPVGRLVLRIAGYDSPALDASSDALCTALQLTNFWQDLERDWARGRLYLPAEEISRCAAAERDLDTGRLTPAWRCVLERAASRTRALFARGRPVCDEVRGRLGLELRLTWLGGMTILDRLERGGFDVFRRRPALGRRDLIPLVCRAALWRH